MNTLRSFVWDIELLDGQNTVEINVEWNDTEERWLDDGFYIPITL